VSHICRQVCRVVLGVSALIGSSAPEALAQSPAPVIEAFRTTTKDVGDRIQMAASAMPTSQYSYRAGPTQRTFAELLQEIARQTDYFCSVVARSTLPSRANWPSDPSKDTLINRISVAFRDCDRALVAVKGDRFSDSVRFAMHDGPAVSIPWARALILSASYWADAYAQLGMYMRANNHVPPEVCRRGAIMWNLNFGCDSGYPRCFDPKGGMRTSSQLTFTDSGYSVRSDGLGPYRPGAGGVLAVFDGPRVGLLAYANDGDLQRAITVDLDHPVPGDTGVPLGVHVERQFFETEAQWMTGPDQAMRSLLDIPVGMTIAADQVEVNFMLDGAVHVLQVGPQSAGHCYSDPTTIHGAGTSRGTIRREAENRWVVDVPAGSIARLFDRHLGDPNAISRGRYYVSLHYTVIH
jgi:hypothetical protein